MTRESNREQLPPEETPAEGLLLTDEQQWPEEEPPPIGRSWATLYAVVLVTLAVLVLLFYRFTRAFS